MKETLPEYSEWVKTQGIEIHIQIDVGDERAVDTTFGDLEDLEMSLHKLHRWVEASLKEQYDFEERLREDDDED